MKANYMKPLLALELFSTSQSIARDCADSFPKGEINLNDPGACVWDLGGGTSVFVAGTCSIDGEAAGYGCYNNPNEDSYIFRS